jgi:nicotinamide-nucleotide amidase
MMEKTILPKIKERFTLPVIYHKMIQTVGIGESWLSDRIESWETSLPSHIKLAYLPHFGRVRLRLTAFGDHLQVLAEEVEEQIKKLLPLIEKFVYGFDELSLEEAVGRLLLAQNKTVAVAESCTGGHIAHTFTRIPGSSNYFQGGIVPYHNDLKTGVLGVKKETIKQFGAVSEQTVTEMAQQVRTLLHADIGLASTGIAGPGGGTPEKPVGTVWIALSDGIHTYTRKLTLTQNRLLNIEYTSMNVLNLLRLTLTGFIDKEDYTFKFGQLK